MDKIIAVTEDDLRTLLDCHDGVGVDYDAMSAAYGRLRGALEKPVPIPARAIVRVPALEMAWLLGVLRANDSLMGHIGGVWAMLFNATFNNHVPEEPHAFSDTTLDGYKQEICTVCGLPDDVGNHAPEHEDGPWAEGWHERTGLLAKIRDHLQKNRDSGTPDPDIEALLVTIMQELE